MMNYDDYLSTVNESLVKYLEVTDSLNDTVVGAMKYSVCAGGKRLRPVILLASCNTFCGSVAEAVPFASAIEMIHTYSLIHDDLPALDDDDYRRGIPSCHKKFGEWQAVLAGDALLNLGFQVMLDAVCRASEEKGMKRRLRAFKIIADASGINGMISGQTGDILWEGRNPGIKTLTAINEKKTGAIISAAFEAGAVLGLATESESRAFALAGEKMGLAFQIKDDMLDYCGEFEKLGKLCGSDAKNKKTTYVSVLGPDGCGNAVLQLSEEAKSLIRGVNGNTVFLEKLIDSLVNREK